MRDYDEEDPKKPHPLGVWKKGRKPSEAGEGVPWRPTPRDYEHDRHRHVA
jgi:hypothetical protein